MARWLVANWRWAALNLAALAVMVQLLFRIDEIGSFDTDFEPLVESGK